MTKNPDIAQALAGDMREEAARLAERAEQSGHTLLNGCEIEMEFAANEWQFSSVDARRRNLLDRVPVCAETRLLRQWLERYSAVELMLYEHIAGNEEIAPHIHPLFSPRHDPAPAYDAKGIVEFRSRKLSPLEAANTSCAIMAGLRQGIEDYGLSLEEGPVCHASGSLNRGETNLLLSSNPHDRSIAARGAEAVARAAYDARLMHMNSTSLNPFMAMHVQRGRGLRLAAGRYEARPEKSVSPAGPLFHMLVVNAGMVHALEHSEAAPDQLQTAWMEKCVAESPFHKIRHVLNGSLLDKDGSVIPPLKYIENSASELAYELGIIQDPQRHSHIASFSSPAYTSYLKRLFSEARIVKEGGDCRIEWPAWAKAPFYTPTRYQINWDKLNASVEQVRIAEVPLVLPGYRLQNGIKDEASLAHAMLRSRLLQSSWSAEFNRRLSEAVYDLHGPPPSDFEQRLAASENYIRSNNRPVTLEMLREEKARGAAAAV